MNEKYFVPLELSKKLKELGIKQDGNFWWTGDPESGFTVVDAYSKRTYHGAENYSAFMASEVTEKLPQNLGEHFYLTIYHMDDGNWFVDYTDQRAESVAMPFTISRGGYDMTVYQSGRTMAEALAKVLINLIEKNLITNKEIYDHTQKAG